MPTEHRDDQGGDIPHSAGPERTIEPVPRQEWSAYDSAQSPEPDEPLEVSEHPRKQRLWLHVVLFCVTVATTSLMVSPMFSACLMSILTAHEFGHYFAARYHRVPASLPYFIPAPTLFGTFGAIIRMSPDIPNRKALFDIAAAGPLAGVVLAIPITFVGLMLSTVQPDSGADGNIRLGDPLLMQLFMRILEMVPEEGMVVFLHDVAFAGWVGLFVTALNLLPMGQLDGGHIAHAVFGRRSVHVARLAFVGLLIICVTISYNYAFFLVLVFLTRIRHPPTRDDSEPLDVDRKLLAWILLGVFVLCFVPEPLSLG